jgi:zinc protease
MVALGTVPSWVSALALVALLASTAHAESWEEYLTPEERVGPLPPPPVVPDEYGLISETLPNGLHVTILPDARLPVVATQVWYDVGSVHEPPGQYGMAHLFEHMMFHATEHHEGDELWRWHHVHGGSNNAYTSTERTVYVSQIAPEFHDQVLVFEADRMAHLEITAEGLANEQRIVSEELRVGTLNDPYSRVLTAAKLAVLGDHPYGHEVVGTLEDVDAATVESCRAWYERYYRADNAHLVVVGPVDGQGTLLRVRELYGQLPSGSTPPPPVPALVGWETPPEITVREDLPPLEDIITAFPLPGAESEDTWALQVMLQVLARSRVQPFEDTYTARHPAALDASIFSIGGSFGSFLIFNTTHLRGPPKAALFRWQDVAREELAQLTWLTEERLTAAKRKMTRHELSREYWASSLASSLGSARLEHGDERVAFQRAEQLEAVTREDVARVYRTYVIEGRPVRVRIIPE